MISYFFSIHLRQNWFKILIIISRKPIVIIHILSIFLNAVSIGRISFIIFISKLNLLLHLFFLKSHFLFWTCLICPLYSIKLFLKWLIHSLRPYWLRKPTLTLLLRSFMALFLNMLNYLLYFIQIVYL
jgi:hypothetical protein